MPYVWGDLSGCVSTSRLPRCDRTDSSRHSYDVASACQFPDLAFRQCCFSKDSYSSSLCCLFLFRGFLLSMYWQTTEARNSFLILRIFCSYVLFDVGVVHDLDNFCEWPLGTHYGCLIKAVVHWICRTVKVQQAEMPWMKATFIFVASLSVEVWQRVSDPGTGLNELIRYNHEEMG